MSRVFSVFTRLFALLTRRGQALPRFCVSAHKGFHYIIQKAPLTPAATGQRAE